MMTSSVVKEANIAGDDVCSVENLAYKNQEGRNLEFSPDLWHLGKTTTR